MTQVRAAIVAAVAAVAVSGCGGGTTEVAGKVTYNGKAVGYGNVVLIDARGMSHYGTLGLDGSFKIPGVATGDAKVGVNSPKPVVAEPGAAKGGLKDAGAGLTRGDRTKLATEEQAKVWFVIPEKYADPTASGLRETVASGKAMNIDLK